MGTHIMSTPESKIKNKINKLLASYGERVYSFMPVPSGFGRRTVDYLVCFDGLFVGIEAKRPGGRVTELQKGTLAEIRAASGATFVVEDDEGLRVLKGFFDSVKQL